MPWPGALNPAELKGGAKALTSDACEAYRSAFTAYRARCADFHAGSALALIDALLDRYGAAYDDAKAERAAIDFDDLELRARDLLHDEATRAKLGGALRADHDRRVPGHERGPARHPASRSSATTCSRSATSSSRSTASATPT